jgi:3-deoxy-7-phosphoheptulonate synthase
MRPEKRAGYSFERAAVAVESHGIIVEVHHDPGKALSDGAQSLYPEQFEQLCIQVKTIYNSLKMQ